MLTAIERIANNDVQGEELLALSSRASDSSGQWSWAGQRLEDVIINLSLMHHFERGVEGNNEAH